MFLNINFKFIMPFLIFVIFCFTGLLIRRYLYRLLDHWSQKTTNTVDDAIVISTRIPSIFWTVLIAIYFTIKYADLPSSPMIITIHKVIEVTLIFSVAMAISSILRSTIQDYGSRFGDRLPFTSLTQNLSSIVVITISILMILSIMGISVPSFITALGIGGLAVALALQDTLSNLFSGIYLVG